MYSGEIWAEVVLYIRVLLLFCLYFMLYIVLLAHFVVLQNPLGTLAGVHVSINTENKLMVIAISH